MPASRRLSLLPIVALCAFHAGCASSSASRDGAGASACMSHTSLRSPALTQEDATVSRSAPAGDMVWREGMEVQWSVQSATEPANRSMAGRAIVGPDGKIELGPYGTVPVAGLTDRQAKAAVVNHLSAYVSNPQVTLIPSAITARTNREQPDRSAVSQTTWQAYQPPAVAPETEQAESPPASPPARTLGQRFLGLWKAS